MPLPGGSTRPTQQAIACLLLCSGPLIAQPLPFSEEAIERGLIHPTAVAPTDGRGLAFADLDNDGDPDAIITGGFDGRIGLFENDGTGRFVDRNPSGLALPIAMRANGVVAADPDGDGDLDLYITCWSTPNLLLRNDGEFVFTDIAEEAGVDDLGASTGAAWGDLDGDGLLDLYVANYTVSDSPRPDAAPNRLYRNRGGLRFDELALTLGVDANDAHSYQGAFFDLDRDGDADLYVANDKAGTNCRDWHNMLWRNDGGVFADISEMSGADGCIDSMCVAVGDLDGNLLPDLYVTNTSSGNHLYLNQGAGTFVESAAAFDASVNHTGWGATFLDFDNDGHLDLHVCNSDAPNAFLRSSLDSPMIDIASDLRLDDAGFSYCAAVADIDLDGDLDLAMVNMPGRLRLFINHEGDRRHWAAFRLRAHGANRFAIGASIDVRCAETWQSRQLLAGSGFKTQDDLTVHVGLGEAERIDEVRVTWPGGQITSWTDLEINRVHELHASSACDVTTDGRIDGTDLALFIDRWFKEIDRSLPALLEFLDCWTAARR